MHVLTCILSDVHHYLRAYVLNISYMCAISFVFPLLRFYLRACIATYFFSLPLMSAL